MVFEIVRNLNYKNAAIFDYNEFWATQKTQAFSLPKPIINYLLQSSPSADVYQKLLESCKYFYSNKSYLLLKLVYNNRENKWILEHLKDSVLGYYSMNQLRKYDDMEIWVTEAFEMWDSDNINIASEVLPKIYRCDAVKLLLFGVIKNEDDEEVPFEIIFQSFPVIKEFEYIFSDNTANFDDQTMEKIYKFSNFQRIEIFELVAVPANSDILSLYNTIKETKSYKKFVFRFLDGMPVNFQNQVIAINDEILNAENLDFVPPLISVPEHNNEWKLEYLHSKKAKKYNQRYMEKPYSDHPVFLDILVWIAVVIRSNFRASMSVFVAIIILFIAFLIFRILN